MVWSRCACSILLLNLLIAVSTFRALLPLTAFACIYVSGVDLCVHVCDVCVVPCLADFQ